MIIIIKLPAADPKPHTLCAFFRPFQHLLVLLVRTVNALILTYSIFSLGLPLQWLEVDWKIPPWSQRLLCVLYFEFQNKLYDYYDNITEDSKKPRSIISAEPLPVKLYICRSNAQLYEDWVLINLKFRPWRTLRRQKLDDFAPQN